ncbi:hypothetical protein IP88_05360 [alpha proteobacterium AAP81b]|nr:hypothetical protein IP88_05360 [alpha proteobacterium AAP81b]
MSLRVPVYAIAVAPKMARMAILLAPIAAALAAAAPAPPPPVPPLPAPALAFADVADLTLAAPVIIRATIVATQRIADKAAPGLAPGRTRLLVTARTDAAIVAPAAVPATLTWLWDAPRDARGKLPRPQGAAVLAWLDAPATDGATRLVAGAGLQPATPGLEARIRAIATAARSGDVPQPTGVANGFRGEGTVPGESESQFFLTTRDGGTVALVVTTRPGERRRVAVARGDVIDDAATEVRPETLLQYRLACFLPARPDAVAGDAALAADWQAALAAIGPCGRTLPR